MKTKTLLSAILCGLCASALTGCVSTTTTTTTTLKQSIIKNPDGTTTTNIVPTTTTVTKAKGQDPLKDKADSFTEKSKGLIIKTLTSPAGTSGALSPIEIIFGAEYTYWKSYPIYPGVSTGYTPPVSFSYSSSDSLYNGADDENLASEPGLIPTNAYGNAQVTPVNPLVQTSGTVLQAPAPTINVITNIVSAPTNAAGK